MIRIKFELVPTNVFTRWHCHICGGHTEKVSVLCEAEGLRICETCLEERRFDERLESHAGELEQEAARLRGLVGRIDAPTFDEWKDACQRVDDELIAAIGPQPDELELAELDGEPF